MLRRLLIKEVISTTQLFIVSVNLLNYYILNRSLLAKKLNLFYNDVKNKRTGKMHLQTDLQFNQNQIKNLNNDFNVEIIHTKVRGGKAFAAEQKIREFKKNL